MPAHAIENSACRKGSAPKTTRGGYGKYFGLKQPSIIGPQWYATALRIADKHTQTEVLPSSACRWMIISNFRWSRPSALSCHGLAYDSERCCQSLALTICGSVKGCRQISTLEWLPRPTHSVNLRSS